MKQNAKKNVPLVKQNVIDKELIRRERIEKGSRERIEIERKETKGK